MALPTIENKTLPKKKKKTLVGCGGPSPSLIANDLFNSEVAAYKLEFAFTNSFEVHRLESKENLGLPRNHEKL